MVSNPLNNHDGIIKMIETAIHNNSKAERNE